MDIILKQKSFGFKFILLALFNFGVILLSNIVYIIVPHYSEDSFEAMLNISAMANTNLRNGRVIHYLLYKILGVFDLSILRYENVTQIILAIITALGITILAIRFIKLFYNKTVIKMLLIDLTILLLVTNPNYMLGWYYWPETVIGCTISSICIFSCLFFWCKESRTKKDILACFVLLCISLGMYQIYIEWFVGVALVYSVIKHKGKLTQKSFQDYLWCILMAGIAAVINIFIMTLLQKMQVIYVDGRSATMSLEIIIDNINYIIANQGKIWVSMYGILPKFWLLFICVIPVLIIILSITKYKKSFRFINVFYILAVILTIYIVTFAANIISGSIWLAPRTIVGIYILPMLLILLSLLYVSDIRYLKIYIMILALFMGSIVVKMIDIQGNTIVTNRFDQAEINRIEYEIRKYENATGIKIDTILYHYDASRRYDYDGVEYVLFDNNTRGMAYSWCFENMICFYTNLDVEVRGMSDADYSYIYNNAEWDVFTPNEQLVFQGNTLFVAIY